MLPLSFSNPGSSPAPKFSATGGPYPISIGGKDRLWAISLVVVMGQRTMTNTFYVVQKDDQLKSVNNGGFFNHDYHKAVNLEGWTVVATVSKGAHGWKNTLEPQEKQ